MEGEYDLALIRPLCHGHYTDIVPKCLTSSIFGGQSITSPYQRQDTKTYDHKVWKTGLSLRSAYLNHMLSLVNSYFFAAALKDSLEMWIEWVRCHSLSESKILLQA